MFKDRFTPRNTAIVIVWMMSVSSLFQQSGKAAESLPDSQYATIDVLVFIYSNTAGGKIPVSEVNRIEKGIELSRLFVWRNSGCRLNLHVSYLLIDEYKPPSFFPDDGMLYPASVEADFRELNVLEDRYGVIVCLYAAFRGSGHQGGMTIGGRTGYAFLSYPFPTQNLYPGDDPTIDYVCTCLFTEVFTQTLESVCYAPAKAWQREKYSSAMHQNFGRAAENLRRFDDYLKITRPFGYLCTSQDSDDDSLPDNDPRVPVDERRFNSDPKHPDTDLDGRSDLAEFMAGIYRGSNPMQPDSDGDGLPDGNDAYPLYNVVPEIPKFTPDMEAELKYWYRLAYRLDYATPQFLKKNNFYMSWDDRYLYLASLTDTPAELHIDLDLTGDGWGQGRDNCRLVVDPFSDRFTEIRVLDNSERTGLLRSGSDGYPSDVWDDDPEYITRFGRLIDEFSCQLSTACTASEFIIKIAFPENSLLGFNLTQHSQLGIRIHYISSVDRAWGTFFEHDTFFPLTLK